MSVQRKVLVTNGSRRKAAPIIRSLSRAGATVHVIDAGAVPASRFSRYCSRFVQCPDPGTNASEFAEWLLALLCKEEYFALFPLDEDVIDAILPRRLEFEHYTQLPLPRTDCYRIAHDKSLTARAAQAAGVPIPSTWTPCSAEEVNDLSETLDYPLLIKPRTSSGSRGIARASDAADLRRTWQSVHALYPLPIVQALIPGGGEAYGVSMLFNAKHEPRASFTHRRLREYPRTGGPSTLREAISQPELESQTTRLLQSLCWVGVAMVEYKTDPETQTPYLLEINPRFWGSIPLAIHSGVDFPALLYRTLADGDVDPVFRYEVGARCRWLVGDCLHFLSARPRFTNATHFLASLDRKTACDEINWDDPLMTLGYVVSGAFQFITEPKLRALLRGRR